MTVQFRAQSIGTGPWEFSTQNVAHEKKIRFQICCFYPVSLRFKNNSLQQDANRSALAKKSAVDSVALVTCDVSTMTTNIWLVVPWISFSNNVLVTIWPAAFENKLPLLPNFTFARTMWSVLAVVFCGANWASQERCTWPANSREKTPKFEQLVERSMTRRKT